MGFWKDIRDCLPFLLTAVPACGAVWVWLISARTVPSARRSAAFNATLTLIAATILAADYVRQSADSAIGFTVPWFEAGPLRIGCSFGVDGISLWPMVVLAWAGWVVMLAADRCCPHWTPEAYAGLLCGQSLAMGLFAAQDAVLFLFFCEGWAWWSFFIIGRPGGNERRTAAQRYLLTSSLANWICGLAAIGLAVSAAGIATELYGKPSQISFQFSGMISGLSRAINSHEIAWELWAGYQPVLLGFWLAGLWLRWPIFPLYGWWPSVMSQARAPMAAFFGATTVLLAGYTLFRFLIPVFSSGGTGWAQWAIAGAAGTVLFAGGLACSQNDLRKLAGYLSLAALAAALIAGLTGHAWTSLMCWQMLLMLALSVTASWLLIGRIEITLLTTELSSLSGIAFVRPVSFSLLGVSLGLMTAIPALSLFNGQVIMELLALSRWGWPCLAMIVGQLLGGWAAIRALVNIGFGPATLLEQTRDASAPRELTAGVLLSLALLAGLAPGLWQTPIRSTWEKMYDPFAGVVVPQGKTSSSLKQNTSSRDVRPVQTLKPAAAAGNRPQPWLIASAIWLLSGGALWAASRLRPNLPRTEGVAVGCLILGLAAELAWQQVSPASCEGWQQASMWSLALLGLAAITLKPEAAQPMPSIGAAAWLLRIGAIGWATNTANLVLCGLAWEAAEFSRIAWLRSSNKEASRNATERVRHLISSACFWLGVAGCGLIARTGDFHELSRCFASAETGSARDMTAGAARLGLVGMILLVSGIGCRCGLAPWSLGRRDGDRNPRFPQTIFDQWLGELLGLILLLRIVLMMQGRYAQPMFLLLSIAGAGTALWSAIALAGEGKIRPLLHKVSAIQFSGLVLFTALLTAPHWPDAPATRVILGIDRPLTGWAVWIMTFTVAMTGLISLLLRLGMNAQQEFYFENFSGLFSRRPWAGGALAGWLLGVSCGMPLALFWPRWLSQILAVAMPLGSPAGSLLPNPVALAAVVCHFAAAIVQLAVIGRWMRSILLDPAVSLPAGSSSRWQLALTVSLAAYFLVGGLQPVVLWSWWLGSTR